MARPGNPRRGAARIIIALVAFAALIVGGGIVVPLVIYARAQPSAQQTTSLMSRAAAGEAVAWIELQQRYADGGLGEDDLAACVSAMIAHLKREAAAATPGGSMPTLGLGQQLLDDMLAAGDLGDDDLARLAGVAYDQPPQIRLRTTMRRLARMQFSVIPAPAMIPEVEPLIALRRVVLDDGEEVLVTDHIGNPAAVFGGFTGGLGYLRLTGVPGPHTLRFEFDLAVWRSGRAFGDPTISDPGPPETWADPLHRWRTSVEVPIVLLPEDVSPIELIEAPGDAAAMAAAFTVNGVTIRSSRNGWRGSIDLGTTQRNPHAYAFRILLEADGRTYPLGRVFAGAGSPAAGTFADRIEMPPPGERTTGTVILRPDPVLIESYQGGFEAIWGEPIEFPGVTVQIER